MAILSRYAHIDSEVFVIDQFYFLEHCTRLGEVVHLILLIRRLHRFHSIVNVITIRSLLASP